MSSMPPLVPREHGAYCEIAVPLLTALWMRPPTFGTVAWTVAAVAAFFSHEPMLVLLGRRGARVRKLRGRAASILLAVLAVIGVVSAAIGFVASPPAARWGAAVPIALAGVVAVVVARRVERTGFGEIVVGATLAGAAIPVALASGETVATAGFVWLVFTVGFGASTFAVRGVIERAHGTLSRGASIVHAAGATSVLVAAIALHAAAIVPAFVPLATAPLVLFSVALHLAPPAPKHLRTLGWVLVGAALVTSFIVRGLA